jgi:hypothetical protein
VIPSPVVRTAKSARVSIPAFLSAFVALAIAGCTATVSKNSTPPSQPVTPAISVSVSPTTSSVQIAKGQGFTATVTNDSQNKGVTWALSGSGCSGATCGALSATSSASGAAVTYTAPATAPNPATVTLTATSVSDTTKSAAATITVTTTAPPPPAIVVTVAPMTGSVAVNQTLPVLGTVTNDSQNKGLTWTISGTGCSGATCGAVAPTSTPSGSQVNYIAPPQVPTPPTVTLTATSVTDTTKSASATITITASTSNCQNGTASAVTISPVRGSVPISESLTFTATVANDTCTQGVTWTASAGTFSAQNISSAIYVAGKTGGTVTITATSITVPTLSASATIGVTDLAGVATYHYDLSRDGVNSHEYALTTSNVNTSTFGKLFSCTVDGNLFAQTLWVPNLTIGGKVHNVIFAASAHDTIYAFDADTSPCVTLWSKSLLPAGQSWLIAPDDVGIDEVYPTIGIVGTPVIDLGTKTLYVVAKSKTANVTCTNAVACNCQQWLHALSLIDGSEKAGGPVNLTSTLISVPGTGENNVNGVMHFDPLYQNQRSGLALVNGVVYVPWGSHGDLHDWHGWLAGFNESNLAAAPVVFNVTPNGTEGRGSIWMAGGAPAADSANNLYVVTANGDWDGKTEFSDSILKLSTSGGISVADWFTPWNEATLDAEDADVGSGGAVILVDLPATSPVQHLLIGGGKGDDGNSGKLYVVNRDNLGHFGTSSTAEPSIIVQEFSFGQAIYGTEAFWQNTLYYAGGNGPMNAFSLNPATSTFNTTPSSNSSNSWTFNYPSSVPVISSSGATNGILWSLDVGGFVNASRAASNSGGPVILFAFDATNLAKQLWNSSMVGSDAPGPDDIAVKFTQPTVANGKVYVGSSQEIDAYGLKPH